MCRGFFVDAFWGWDYDQSISAIKAAPSLTINQTFNFFYTRIQQHLQPPLP
jgi:hypothetical protein